MEAPECWSAISGGRTVGDLESSGEAESSEEERARDVLGLRERRDLGGGEGCLRAHALRAAALHPWAMTHAREDACTGGYGGLAYL